MATKIQVRRDTAAAWEGVKDDPSSALAPGEFGLDTTNNILKLGPGTWGDAQVIAEGDLAVGDLQAVTDAGNNTTNDITLGTDKITLDATDGNIAAKGYVYLNGDKGYFAQLRTNVDSADTLLAYFGSNYKEKAIQFLSDGSATYTDKIELLNNAKSSAIVIEPQAGSGQAYLRLTSPDSTPDAAEIVRINNASGVDKAIIKADGSAEFKGDVAIGDSSAFFSTLADVVSRLSEELQTQYATEIAAMDLTTAFTGDPETLPTDINTTLRDALVRVTTAGKINLNSNGSADFAGRVTAKEAVMADTAGSIVLQPSATTAPIALKDASNKLHFHVAPNGTVRISDTDSINDTKITLGATGSADFKGNLTFPNARIILEPDNADNYTTTTEEYTETESYTGPLGNTLAREVTKTRDIRTYTGPTLDVKAVIQELQQRVADRDAVIASFATRLAALESDHATLMGNSNGGY